MTNDELDVTKNEPGVKENLTLGDFMLGIEGLAILRAWPDDPSTVRARVKEISELLKDASLATPISVVEVDVGVGYQTISETYDENSELRNPVIMAEEPALFELLSSVPRGRALDSACGTGRCASHLVSLGHEVIGIDQSKWMLDIARAKVPEASFHMGHVEKLPFEDDAFDLAVCTLALAHSPDLGAATRELARVVRPGGRVITSDVHPFFTSLGLHAFYRPQEGESAFVRNHYHPVSSYVEALGSSGLTVMNCIEPTWSESTVLTIGNTAERVPQAALHALVGLPLILIWSAVKN